MLIELFYWSFLIKLTNFKNYSNDFNKPNINNFLNMINYILKVKYHKTNIR